MTRSRWLLLLALLALPCLAGADWPEFRGAGGAAISADAGLPDHWDKSTNLLWKVELPGQGASRPRLFGDLVIVNAAIESSKVVALDKATGNEKWTFGVARRSWSTPAVLELDGGRKELVVSSDGRVSGLDHNGKELWHCEGVHGYTC